MEVFNPNEDDLLDFRTMSPYSIERAITLLFEHLGIVVVRPKYGWSEGERPVELRKITTWENI